MKKTMAQMTSMCSGNRLKHHRHARFYFRRRRHFYRPRCHRHHQEATTATATPMATPQINDLIG